VINANACVLFQGDSITDAGRDPSCALANDAAAMGNGYAYMAMARLLADHPRHALRVYNRGISGDCVPDLERRWAKDTISIKPDVLSILIGVNDIWHKLDGRYDGSVQDYREGYRALLDSTRRSLPGVHIVIGEPFALRCGAVTERWFPEFDQRRRVAAELAHEFGAPLVEFQSAFDRAVADGTPPEYWAADGVHPTPPGHQLMADTWLAVVAPKESGATHLIP
jgi:lysophospholipase L1-like esterase